MEWISVKDKHFADIEEKGNSYVWESGMIDEPFIVAIPTDKGWCIQQVVLVDEVGLQCWSDEEGAHYFGWSIIDVSHWMPLKPPVK